MAATKRKKILYASGLGALLAILIIIANLATKPADCSSIYKNEKNKYDKGKNLKDYTEIYNKLKQHAATCGFNSKDPALSIRYMHLEIGSAFVSGKTTEGIKIAKTAQGWLSKQSNVRYDDTLSAEATDIDDMANSSLPESVAKKYYAVNPDNHHD